MRHLRSLTWIAATSALALAGCKVGPNYVKPAMTAPAAYSEDGHNGNWSAAQPADASDRGDWWAVYQDPELTDYEQRCAKSNQSIQAALHTYEQAHDIVRETRASLYPTVAIGGSALRNKLSSNKPLRPAGQANDYWDFVIPLTISWE